MGDEAGAAGLVPVLWCGAGRHTTHHPPQCAIAHFGSTDGQQALQSVGHSHLGFRVSSLSGRASPDDEGSPPGAVPGACSGRTSSHNPGSPCRRTVYSTLEFQRPFEKQKPRTDDSGSMWDWKMALGL